MQFTKRWQRQWLSHRCGRVTDDFTAIALQIVPNSLSHQLLFLSHDLVMLYWSHFDGKAIESVTNMIS